jgi:uncharacterized RmlC-like cupin family protein
MKYLQGGVTMSNTEAKNKGAIKGGNGKFIFDLPSLQRMDAGTGYSSAVGPVVEGERIQVGLITMKAGTGARPHTHPNEQWTYLLQGKARISVDGQPEIIGGAGTLVYTPPQRGPLCPGPSRRGRHLLHLQGHVTWHYRQGG